MMEVPGSIDMSGGMMEMTEIHMTAMMGLTGAIHMTDMMMEIAGILMTAMTEMTWIHIYMKLHV